MTAAIPLQPAIDNVLSVDGVTVRLNGRTILDDVSFDVPASGFCGLIGSNGAGKTTLLRVLLGLISPGSGHVHVAPNRERGGVAIGYVPQKISLDGDLPLRARDLIGLGLDGHRLGTGWPNRNRRNAIQDMVEAVGATRFADNRVGNLSGGEQQRVMIAQALISRPRLLLLDEPLANLDIRSAAEVVDLLARIARDHGVAIVLSAHDMNPLLRAMDQVVYLADGRAVSGTTDEVIQSDTLSRLYRHDVEVIRAQGRVLVVSGGDPADTDGLHHTGRAV